VYVYVYTEEHKQRARSNIQNFTIYLFLSIRRMYLDLIMDLGE